MIIKESPCKIVISPAVSEVGFERDISEKKAQKKKHHKEIQDRKSHEYVDYYVLVKAGGSHGFDYLMFEQIEKYHIFVMKKIGQRFLNASIVAAMSPDLKTALPATSTSAPAWYRRAALSRLTPPSTSIRALEPRRSIIDLRRAILE